MTGIPSAAMDVNALIRTLRDYDPSINQDELRAAYDDEDDSALRSWVATHINTDTLLTIDELAQ
jgi:hypothetical protein